MHWHPNVLEGGGGRPCLTRVLPEFEVSIQEILEQPLPLLNRPWLRGRGRTS